MFNNITQLYRVTRNLTQICTFACYYQIRSQKHKMKKKSNILSNDKDKWRGLLSKYLKNSVDNRNNRWVFCEFLRVMSKVSLISTQK